ncbi:GNAT family N-acetyltransferase [Enterococcus italicus]
MIKKLTEMSTHQLGQIMNIWLHSNIEAHSFISRDYWVGNYNLVEQMLPKSDIYVYYQNDEIIGFLGLDNNYIAGIFVKKESRNKGIGRELLNEARKEKNELTLSVYKKNDKAMKFYTRNDFVVKSKYAEKETEQVSYDLFWKNT